SAGAARTCAALVFDRFGLTDSSPAVDTFALLEPSDPSICTIVAVAACASGGPTTPPTNNAPTNNATVRHRLLTMVEPTSPGHPPRRGIVRRTAVVQSGCVPTLHARSGATPAPSRTGA